MQGVVILGQGGLLFKGLLIKDWKERRERVMLIQDKSTAGKGTSKGKVLKQGPCSSNGKRAKRRK